MALFYGIADPEKIYQDQLAQSTVCTWAQSAGGTTILDSVGLGISFSGSGGTQSLGNNSAAGSEEQKAQVSRRTQSHPSLPSIDEVDSPEKTKEDIGNKTKVDVGSNTIVDVRNDGITTTVIEATNVDLGEPSINVTIEMELEERIKKLREEAAEFERLRNLRQEAVVLECGKVFPPESGNCS